MIKLEIMLSDLFGLVGSVVGAVVGSVVGLSAVAIGVTLGLSTAVVGAALESGCTTYEEITDFSKRH